jgi:hypothetical protein
MIVNASVSRIIAIDKPSACSANEILGWLIHCGALMFSPALNWFNNRTAHPKDDRKNNATFEASLSPARYVVMAPTKKYN